MAARSSGRGARSLWVVDAGEATAADASVGVDVAGIAIIHVDRRLPRQVDDRAQHIRLGEFRGENLVWGHVECRGGVHLPVDVANAAQAPGRASGSANLGHGHVGAIKLLSPCQSLGVGVGRPFLPDLIAGPEVA